ncbi:MAG TPA: alpha/beta hydrolase [Acidimicrobiales bacterium]|nr:alpha/beta hydrolase [Acidimicrobiales bacterium]
MDVSEVVLESGLQLSYAERGDPSGPTVMLLPGPTDSWLSYRQFIGSLPMSIRAIAVSQRGHGDSTKPPSGYRVEDFAADIPPLLAALHIERAVLAGHSGSCLVARRVALDRPELVSGLVLEASPTTLRDHDGLKRFVQETVADLEDPIDHHLARSVIADTSSDAVRPELVDQLVEELLKVPARAWKEMFAGLLEYDDVEDLNRLAAPTVLVWGDADTIVPRSMQDELARSIPEAALLVYHGVGHTPRWEVPSRFAADVTAFVERVSRS